MSDDYAWEDYNRATDERLRDADNEWRDWLADRQERDTDRFRDRAGLGESGRDTRSRRCVRGKGG